MDLLTEYGLFSKAIKNNVQVQKIQSTYHFQVFLA